MKDIFLSILKLDSVMRSIEAMATDADDVWAWKFSMGRMPWPLTQMDDNAVRHLVSCIHVLQFNSDFNFVIINKIHITHAMGVGRHSQGA